MTEKHTSSADEDHSDDMDGQKPLSQPEKKSLLAKVFPFLQQRHTSSLREDLTDALANESADNPVFSPMERTLLNNIMQFREARIDDVMIPRSQINALDINTSLGDALLLFEKSGHSRLPIYVESLDDPRGMIHIRDVLNHITRSAVKAAKKGKLDLSSIELSKPIGELDLIRTVLFVPNSMLASQLLRRMQATRTQIALVIDEYGGTDGLVSMEDIVELVVGDIEDEHDDEDSMIITEADGCWLVDGRAELEDVEEIIGSDFKPGETSEEVDTIGGLIVFELDRIPARGEDVDLISGFRFHILEADKRRIRRLRIRRLPDAEQPTEKKK